MRYTQELDNLILENMSDEDLVAFVNEQFARQLSCTEEKYKDYTFDVEEHRNFFVVTIISINHNAFLTPPLMDAEGKKVLKPGSPTNTYRRKCSKNRSSGVVNVIP